MPGLESMRRRLSSIAKGSSEPSSTPPSHSDLDTRLLDPDFFHIEDDDRYWFARVNIAVRTAMTLLHTPSHDYMHVQRVTLSAYSFYLDEKHLPWTRDIDPRTVVVAAMVHEIGAIRYAQDHAENVRDFGPRRPDGPDTVQTIQHDLVFEFLRRLDCPPDVAGPAALMASLVSFTREMQNREKVAEYCEAYPALKFVLDADRLDGLGFVGIARLGAFGIHAEKRSETILSMVHLIDTRFVHYVGLMKTKGGKKEAEKRWAQMLEFRDGLVNQTNCSVGLRSD
ncbi:Aldehyde dehydrogenase (NAD(+)) [Ascochyta rabiei]|uniref:Uncharacterized protein n=1 Tax=Didymella rabiei TaxID=5454 RepID=A0A163IXA4_DIDRA|nr:Aldehyde dehydrogenase (NAD(+)) [Ascochyta rabiei]KZM26004.1 hypothetical protein ST47_g2839 [Ascochyta rabiei]UPX18539.1 Aldehyde dehydrogenase (NAD(+)) [Ascochyta rabiei]